MIITRGYYVYNNYDNIKVPAVFNTRYAKLIPGIYKVVSFGDKTYNVYKTNNRKINIREIFEILNMDEFVQIDSNKIIQFLVEGLREGNLGEQKEKTVQYCDSLGIFNKVAIFSPFCISDGNDKYVFCSVLERVNNDDSNGYPLIEMINALSQSEFIIAKKQFNKNINITEALKKFDKEKEYIEAFYEEVENIKDKKPIIQSRMILSDIEKFLESNTLYTEHFVIEM